MLNSALLQIQARIQALLRPLVPAQQVLLKSQLLRMKLYSFDKQNTAAKVWKHWP